MYQFLYSRLWHAEENDVTILVGSPHRYHGLLSRLTIKYHSHSPYQIPDIALNHLSAHSPYIRRKEHKHENSGHSLLLQCKVGGFSEVEPETGINRERGGNLDENKENADGLEV